MKEKKHENIIDMLEKIDEPLKINIIKNECVAIILVITAIIVSFMAKNFNIFLFMFFLAIVYASIFIYHGLKYLDGDVRKYTGECISISSLTGKNKNVRRYIVVKIDEETLLKVYNDRAYKICDLNDYISLYIPSSALYQINENTYASNAVYYSFIQKSSTKTNIEND